MQEQYESVQSTLNRIAHKVAEASYRSISENGEVQMLLLLLSNL